jgi:glycosyltransferase involved in cell wall biosynthesis
MAMESGSTLHHPPLSISAVLPAYNEEASIAATVRQVAAALSDLGREFEIIVTNDGSHDGTAATLTQLLDHEPELHLRVVTHPVNRGYGAALASGFDAASRDLVFMTDSRLLDAMDASTDMVIGWREKRADPPLRLLNARGWKLLVNGLFGYTAHDVDCAFKLFRRKVWTEMFVHARGATFSAEMLIKARRLGFTIREVPVSHLKRSAGSPTGARLSVIIRAFI